MCLSDHAAATAAVPVRVDYELTALGHDLQAVVEPLQAWAQDNIDQILEHRNSSRSGTAAIVRADPSNSGPQVLAPDE